MTLQLNRKTEAGFTLVELAIVLMIIGLLIGGILRGQELMENARVTSTIQQTKAYDGATTTFRDAYAALPGDIVNPGTRLANCASAPCNTVSATAGNGIIGTTTTKLGTLVTTAASENNNFWIHLAATHLISGVNPSSTTLAWGEAFPAAKIAGGFHVASINQTAAAGPPVVVGMNGVYLVLNASPTSVNVAEAQGVSAISPLRAAQIDRKLDDALPNSGDVVGLGTTACTGATYTETVETNDCDLLIHLQN